MIFRWNQEMLSFMSDAAGYGDYYAQLSSIVAPYLPEGGHVCDAGCGPGYLSLALSPLAGRITAVDVSHAALSILTDTCHARHLYNIVPVAGDIHTLPPETPYDAMVFCFFGQIREILTLAAQQCRGAVVILAKDYDTHRFSVGTHASPAVFSSAAACLDALGIPHETRRFSLEAGQPFRDLSAARRFFALYSWDNDPGLITDAFLKSRLRETGRADFPLYLPQKRDIGLISLDARDIPDNIQAILEHERKKNNEIV